MSDKQDEWEATSDANSSEPPNKERSGEGSGSALSAMLKKRREGHHGVPENEEDQDNQDAASGS